jgi:hypothetical protein
VGDAALTKKMEALGDLPADSLGRGLFEFYRCNAPPPPPSGLLHPSRAELGILEPEAGPHMFIL